MIANAPCQLRIIRHSGFADFLRSYKIIINGSEVGSIARNSVLNIEVPSGPLRIEAQVDWGRSRPLLMEATPNQKIEIEVSNHWGALLAIWAITFGYRSYLALKQLPNATTA
jgi:hypothetical protein